MSKADRTREQIIKAAAETFRARDSDRVGVASVMASLKLSSGGLSAHFRRRGSTTVEIEVNYPRAVTLTSRLLTATGEVAHTGRLRATASKTCLLLERPERPRQVPPVAIEPGSRHAGA